jgi:hypothetical protein
MNYSKKSDKKTIFSFFLDEKSDCQGSPGDDLALVICPFDAPGSPKVNTSPTNKPGGLPPVL